jgi:hypothetical protein
MNKAYALLDRLRDDNQWATPEQEQRIGELASLYWKHRWGNDEAAAKAVWEELGGIPAKRVKRVEEGRIVYGCGYGGSRYLFDFELNLKEWLQFDTTEDAHYFGIWVNPRTLEILTFAEGDVSLVVYADAETYNAGIDRLRELHTHAPAFIAIDLDGITEFYDNSDAFYAEV